MPTRPLNKCSECGKPTFGSRCRHHHLMFAQRQRRVAQTDDGPSWWIGLDREAFNAMVKAREAQRQQDGHAYAAPEYS